MCLQIYIYIIYMKKEDLALNNLEWLICHKTYPNQTSNWNQVEGGLKSKYFYKQDHIFTCFFLGGVSAYLFCYQNNTVGFMAYQTSNWNQVEGGLKSKYFYKQDHIFTCFFFGGGYQLICSVIKIILLVLWHVQILLGFYANVTILISIIYSTTIYHHNHFKLVSTPYFVAKSIFSEPIY